MSDPRWTVSDWNHLVWDGIDEDDSQWFYEVPDQAHIALVAAVRDADLLRQARELAETFRHSPTHKAMPHLHALLDLLVPLSGTPTGTHPQAPHQPGAELEAIRQTNGGTDGCDVPR